MGPMPRGGSARLFENGMTAPEAYCPWRISVEGMGFALGVPDEDDDDEDGRGGVPNSPPGIMMVEPTTSGWLGPRPLNCAISFWSAPYFLAIDWSVSPATTVRCPPEMGRIISVSPGCTSLTPVR